MAHSPLSLDSLAGSPTLVPSSETRQHVLVRVRAADGDPTRKRPRLTAMLVIDVSGSMQGAPITQVIQSTQRLAEILGDDDSLGVVAFSDGARTVSPPRLLTAEARRAIHREVAKLAADGSTNLSGGLSHAVMELPARAPGERHLALVMSDGQPNVGTQAPSALGEEARRWKQRDVAVSTLGFGAAHNEEVLIAIADGGGGRYAFVDDPKLAGASFARALGAQRDVVAEDVRLLLTPAPGVEIVRVLGNPPSSFGADGMRLTLQDAIAGDELNFVVELDVKTPGEGGPWRPLKLELSGRLAGAREEFRVKGEVAVHLSHVGPYEPDRAVLIEVAIAVADELRAEARALADRNNFAGAAAILRKAQALIAAVPGFVAGGNGPGDPLYDAHETLADEIAAMDRVPDAEKYQAHKRASRDYADFAHGGTKVRGATHITQSQGVLLGKLAGGALPRAWLVVVDGTQAGQVLALGVDQMLGRAPDNAIQIADATMTRRHTRIIFDGGAYWLVDLGSSNGTKVNGLVVGKHQLAHGDVIEAGNTRLRFELL